MRWTSSSYRPDEMAWPARTWSLVKLEVPNMSGDLRHYNTPAAAQKYATRMNMQLAWWRRHVHRVGHAPSRLIEIGLGDE